MKDKNSNKNNILYLVVPCYNEELVLNECSKQLSKVITELIDTKKISTKSKICFVDDGSKDKTWDSILDECEKNKLITGIKLAHNRGHQFALLSGLMTVKKYADMVITIDADLQQDIECIDRFVDEYLNGYDIVYGVRISRDTDSSFKRMSSQFFYKLMNFFGCESINNHADYRLTSKKVLDELENYKECNLYLRGLFPFIGFKSTIVYFEVFNRFAGSSKYNFKKMITLATDGITSFSVKPIRFIFLTGIIMTIISSILEIFLLIFNNCKLDISIVLDSMFLIGGLIITSLGVVGEYVGKTYFESKNRPNYCIERFEHENIK